MQHFIIDKLIFTMYMNCDMKMLKVLNNISVFMKRDYMGCCC